MRRFEDGNFLLIILILLVSIGDLKINFLFEVRVSLEFYIFSFYDFSCSY